MQNNRVSEDILKLPRGEAPQQGSASALGKQRSLCASSFSLRDKVHRQGAHGAVGGVRARGGGRISPQPFAVYVYRSRRTFLLFSAIRCNTKYTVSEFGSCARGTCASQAAFLAQAYFLPLEYVNITAESVFITLHFEKKKRVIILQIRRSVTKDF